MSHTRRTILLTAMVASWSLVLSACTTHVAGLTPHATESLPAAVRLQSRVLPESSQRQLRFVFPQENVKDNDVDVSVQPRVKIKQGAGVIIDIPEYEKWQSEQKKRAKSSSPASAPDEDSKRLALKIKKEESTGGNFGLAQQEFERALIAKGLNVLDRKKFEAKLRDSRDSVNNRIDDRLQAKSYREGYDEAKRKIKIAFDAGEFSQDELRKKMAELESEFLIGSQGGRNRNEDEMSDTAEVIRAALLGDKDEVKPDYLLQMRLTFPETFPRPLVLKDRPEYAAFLAKNPEFTGLGLYDPTKDSFDATQSTPRFPIRIQTPWYYVESEAKLIDIKTGSVLWIGSIRTQSNNIEEFQLAYTITRQLDREWADSVSSGIDTYNNKLDQLDQEARRAETRLNSVLAQYRDEKSMSSDQAQAYVAYRKYEVDAAEQAYAQASQELRKFQTTLPGAMTETPQFRFTVSPLLITPDMRITADMPPEAQQQRNEEIMNHKRKLLRKAAQSLINTLPVN